jgi:O-antigen/teichoic acid export membrane protein
MSLALWFRKIIFANRFLHYGFLLTAIHIAGGALGYVYQIIIGRILQPTDFALFSSVMALSVFVSAPLSAMSMIIVRRVSALKAHASIFFVKSLFFKINQKLLILGLPIFCIFWIAKPYLQYYLKIENDNVIIIFMTIVLFSIFNVAGLAFFQGLQRFILLGSLGLLSVAGKIIISAGLIHFGLGVEGALLGVLLSMVLIYLITITNLFSSLPTQVPYQHFHFNFSSIKRIAPVVAATTAFAAMTQLDMAIVNWYFPSKEAGLYAAASVLGKAVLYLPGGLILALFPIVSENHAKGSDSFGIFRQAVIVTILLCSLIACIYWFFGDLIISVLYGESYRGAGEILNWYGVAILPLAVIVIAEHYLIARGKVLFAWLFLIILPVELLVIYIWHSKIWMILLAMGGFGSLLAVVGSGLMWRSAKLN